MKAAKAAFWDTSAILPLCTVQSSTSLSARYSRQFSKKVVWWATPVEATSALMREFRDGTITVEEKNRAFQRLKVLESTWNEEKPRPVFRKDGPLRRVKSSR